MSMQVGVLVGEPYGTCRYVEEVLAHAGLFYSPLSVEELPDLVGQRVVLLLAGSVRLSHEQLQTVQEFVTLGGALVAIGSSSGLEDLFGVEQVTSGFEAGFGVAEQCGLGEGYIQPRRKNHPVITDMGSSLHTFGGIAVCATQGTSIARMRDGLFRPTRQDAIVEHRVGKGLALLIAPDLLASIVRIQQGTYIDQDGIPASDGSAPLDDGILKCEDGMTLSFEWDRTEVDADNRIFLHPIADELRELVIKSVLYSAQRQRIPLAMLWYYPRGLPALGHISHDSDINDAQLAWSMLQTLQAMELKTTWCIVEPGYPADFYDALKTDGYEIALHYDALDGRPRTRWHEQAFLGQFDWLSRAANTRPRSNKNHYTRWEGRLDFFRWCEQVGIQCDQSKGPSKRGTLGYPFGGCHPWFPLDSNGQFIDCLELNLQTQDLVVTCPESFGRYWVDQAARHHGVAHLLFHPAHIEKPGVADALRNVVAYGCTRGFEWWTCAQVNDWERARRSVQLQSVETEKSGSTYHFLADSSLKDATLLFMNVSKKGTQVTRYGFKFREHQINLTGETEVRLE